MLPLRNSLSQKIKIKGMYTASLSQPYKPVEPQRGYRNAATAVVCVVLRLILFLCSLYVTQALTWPAVFPFWLLLLFRGLHPNIFHSHTHTHTSVCFSSALFGSVQVASGTSFMYNNQRGGDRTWKSARLCVFFLFYQADRPTDPQDCCPPGLPA